MNHENPVTEAVKQISAIINNPNLTEFDPVTFSIEGLDVKVNNLEASSYNKLLTRKNIGKVWAVAEFVKDATLNGRIESVEDFNSILRLMETNIKFEVAQVTSVNMPRILFFFPNNDGSASTIEFVITY